VQDDQQETGIVPEKKTTHAAEQQRADVEERRSEWKAKQNGLDPARLVFLDDSGETTGMTPACMDAPPSNRA
jgi:predicted phosphoribosyltransferase